IVATTRVLIERPANLWILAAAIGRVTIRDTTDDLLKLALLRRVRASSHVASRIDMATKTLSLVTEPGEVPGGSPEPSGSAEIERIVWDHSAVSDHLLAQVGFGRRLRVYLGAGGVHEFTAIEALPASARRAILR